MKIKNISKCLVGIVGMNFLSGSIVSTNALGNDISLWEYILRLLGFLNSNTVSNGSESDTMSSDSSEEEYIPFEAAEEMLDIMEELFDIKVSCDDDYMFNALAENFGKLEGQKEKSEAYIKANAAIRKLRLIVEGEALEGVDKVEAIRTKVRMQGAKKVAEKIAKYNSLYEMFRNFLDDKVENLKYLEICREEKELIIGMNIWYESFVSNSGGFFEDICKKIKLEVPTVKFGEPTLQDTNV